MNGRQDNKGLGDMIAGGGELGVHHDSGKEWTEIEKARFSHKPVNARLISEFGRQIFVKA